MPTEKAVRAFTDTARECSNISASLRVKFEGWSRGFAAARAQHLQVDSQNLTDTDRVDLEGLHAVLGVGWAGSDDDFSFEFNEVPDFEALAGVGLYALVAEAL